MLLRECTFQHTPTHLPLLIYFSSPLDLPPRNLFFLPAYSLTCPSSDLFCPSLTCFFSNLFPLQQVLSPVSPLIYFLPAHLLTCFSSNLFPTPHLPVQLSILPPSQQIPSPVLPLIYFLPNRPWPSTNLSFLDLHGPST